MPEAAFADMWATLKAGRPWVGMVKNRCKNGDHYWVEAHATPVFEQGKVAGYMSVHAGPNHPQADRGCGRPRGGTPLFLEGARGAVGTVRGARQAGSVVPARVGP